MIIVMALQGSSSLMMVTSRIKALFCKKEWPRQRPVIWNILDCHHVEKWRNVKLSSKPWETVVGNFLPGTYLTNTHLNYNLDKYILISGPKNAVPWKQCVMGIQKSGIRSQDLWKYQTVNQTFRTPRTPYHPFQHIGLMMSSLFLTALINWLSVWFWGK